jgi:hypothetical protein
MRPTRKRFASHALRGGEGRGAAGSAVVFRARDRWSISGPRSSMRSATIWLSSGWWSLRALFTSPSSWRRSRTITPAFPRWQFCACPQNSSGHWTRGWLCWTGSSRGAPRSTNSHTGRRPVTSRSRGRTGPTSPSRRSMARHRIPLDALPQPPLDTTIRPQSRQRHVDEGQRIRSWPCTPASFACKKHVLALEGVFRSPPLSCGSGPRLARIKAAGRIAAGRR